MRPEVKEVLDAGRGLEDLIGDAQLILEIATQPEADAVRALNELLTLLDGPRQRAVQERWRVAAARANIQEIGH
ncbi:MAG TPA: hypothetical protein VHZ09_03660 [Acidobacteriaceae bacterium]|jgi:hypothetical protein|nr:hypothetical protein [Acidobacteriaceae bacterium]